MISVDDLIQRLKLEPHPKEGGYFRETYRSAASSSQAGYHGPRNHGTAIYYLLKPGTFSALHRLRGDEIFHFYLGDPVRMLQLFSDGTSRTIILGPHLDQEQHVQVVVPGGVWQGTLLEPGSNFALLGCTVAPGFDYADYEHGDRETLLRAYPDQRDLIEKLATPPA